MRKIFLSSSFKDVAKLLPKFVGDGLKNKTVTFIPTAALNEKVNFYVKSGKKALEKMGLIVDELEISTADSSEIVGKLQKNDYIYVTGGNTFFLLQELRKTGADKIIMAQIELGKLYIGESAGSIVLAPNIEYVKEMDDPQAASDLADFNGLGAVDFYPLPHQNCFPFKKTVARIIKNYESTLPLMPITNAQAILVEGETITLS